MGLMFGFNKAIPELGAFFQSKVGYANALNYLSSIQKERIGSVTLELRHACIIDIVTASEINIIDNALYVSHKGILYFGSVSFAMNSEQIVIEKEQDMGYGGTTVSKLTINLKD